MSNVYFIQYKRRIKIGVSKDVEKRQRDVSAHLIEGTKLIAKISGDAALERAIQKHLQQWHIKGEWFRDCQQVRNLISILVQQGPDALGIKPKPKRDIIECSSKRAPRLETLPPADFTAARLRRLIERLENGADFLPRDLTLWATRTLRQACDEAFGLMDNRKDHSVLIGNICSAVEARMGWPKYEDGIVRDLPPRDFRSF